MKREDLRHYLLGKAAPEAARAIERAYFADDNELADLQVAETELIGDYASGKLNQNDRQAFELRFASSAELWGRVRIAVAAEEAKGTTARTTARAAKLGFALASAALVATNYWRLQNSSADEKVAQVFVRDLHSLGEDPSEQAQSVYVDDSAQSLVIVFEAETIGGDHEYEVSLQPGLPPTKVKAMRMSDGAQVIVLIVKRSALGSARDLRLEWTRTNNEKQTRRFTIKPARD